jgi:hypothetical protein
MSLRGSHDQAQIQAQGSGPLNPQKGQKTQTSRSIGARIVLDRTVAKEAGPAMSARLASFDQKQTKLTPGTVLVREWDRQSQRVMVMADGFAWNGQTYDSLSKVAFAITGTKWSGPRRGLLSTLNRLGR